MQGLKYGNAAAASNQLQLQLSAANGDTLRVTLAAAPPPRKLGVPYLDGSNGKW